LRTLTCSISRPADAQGATRSESNALSGLLRGLPRKYRCGASRRGNVRTGGGTLRRDIIFNRLTAAILS